MAAESTQSGVPAQPTGDTLVDIRNLKVHFPIKGGLLGRAVASVKAVDGVDLQVKQGEVLGLVGESGCGKSTLGRAVLQLIKPTAGEVYFKGEEISHLSTSQIRHKRANMQMIFQDPFSSLDPRYTVGRVVAEPLENFNRGTRQERLDRVKELLQVVGLNPNYVNRYPHEFSGGQRQRIGIARALALNPQFIVADEPISALDVSIQAQVLNLLLDLQNQFNLTYLFIAHNLAAIKHISNRVAVMYLGHIVELGNAEEVYNNPQHPYTIALLSASPLTDPDLERQRKRIILVGDVPSPVNPPSGCPFNPRCWRAQAICREVAPPLEAKRPNHLAACHFPGPEGQ
ncbi:MAG TPA: dipeptide ABC transporter ATP-binding protein [Ktedonobacterales bacterium]|jgi:oligopeptide transport system ATP-binding protein|nr:dipeptide ABC transporter ATP-binding protein [Ktedonobacterales bacterium]HKW21478.1 dipeptide ABC transporter ATP-binding protein [Ktedonobacterales bacterium]